jgi:hypothetical protein
LHGLPELNRRRALFQTELKPSARTLGAMLPAMKAESRDALVTAIAKARGSTDDIRLGRIRSKAHRQVLDLDAGKDLLEPIAQPRSAQQSPPLNETSIKPRTLRLVSDLVKASS